MERLKSDLTNSIRDKGISGVSVERVEGTQLQIKAATASVDRVRSILKADFANLSEAKTPQTSATGTDFFMTLNRKKSRALRDYIVDQSLETIRNRIDQFGVSEPVIQRQGLNRYSRPTSRHPRSAAGQGYHRQDRAFGVQIGRRQRQSGRCGEERRAAGAAGALRPGRQRPAGAGPAKVPYVLEARTLMTGEYIKDARVRPGEQLQGPYVELILNDQGGRLFEQITAANVKRRMAIVLDNNVYSAPVIQERIGGGRASITGSFDIKEARDLSIVLRAGALPAPVEIVEERTVGPSLGSDSITSGHDFVRRWRRVRDAVHARLLQEAPAWSLTWRWSSTSCSWLPSSPVSKRY